ncbi:ubiquitin carboxyl-terminal hydrolase [Trichophyton tonsurans CBS 112818]|uniref:Ubiquitin carboxyl-terminal hydrolase n=1 Tax=Trichophyton tonsurans (strain CBS 112818) TaxID=647933 RepID=F2RQJ6_TRIT1|nr:ubiquitin carboxyl-terminal hydrolase [Trichophyton tonsurans CBS 112818]
MGPTPLEHSSNITAASISSGTGPGTCVSPQPQSIDTNNPVVRSPTGNHTSDSPSSPVQSSSSPTGCSELMEELNSESTRKRPRLDSGSGANCTHDSASMTTPTTPAETSEDTQDSQQDLQTPQNQVDNTPGTIKEGAVGTPGGCSVHGGGPPTAGEDQDGMPITPLPAASSQKSMNGSPVVPPRPSSRVTINMKSPSSETAQSQATPEDGEATASSTEKQDPAIESGNNVSKPELEPIPQLDGESAVFQTSSNPAVNHDIHSSIPMERTTIVIPDSPSSAASVEIEVADPEDMDQDPATTSWRPLDDAIRTPREPEVVQIHEETSLAEAFPNFRAAYNIRECVLDMKAAMERGTIRDRSVFDALRTWFDLCSETISVLTYQAFIEDRDFWEEVPSIIEGLLRRTTEFVAEEGERAMSPVEQFLSSYVDIAMHVISLDTQQLSQSPDDRAAQYDPISRTYWMPLASMLQLRKIPLYTAMERDYGSEIIDLVGHLNDCVAGQQVNGVLELTNFMRAVSPFLAKSPILTSLFTSALNVAHNVLDSFVGRRYQPAYGRPNPKEVISRVYALLRFSEPVYRSLIEKSSSCLSSDTSETIIRTMGNSFRILCSFDEESATAVGRDLELNVPDGVNSLEFAHIVSLGWKFTILKKHIMSGRMELRVYGMESIQGDLVNFWSQHIQNVPGALNHATTKYLVNFLREHKIVDYVVGVESHPQLISRGSNIVGFLVVTSTYTNEDTDIIWKTVSESHDPRTVSEVLAMLSSTFSMHHESEPLIYICNKLIELPLQRFDVRMIEFCDMLLNAVRSKHGESLRHQELGHYPHVDIMPVRLCVRLIRGALSSNELPLEQRSQIQRFASKQLSQFVSLGIREADKTELYQQCIQDVSDMNEFALGSIHALNALIPTFDTQDIRRLALDLDFTRLIITELAHAATAPTPDGEDEHLCNAIVPRLNLVHRIIDKVPETISPELSDILWDKVFTSKVISEQNRNYMWEILSKSASRCLKRNAFLETFMNDYLPRILPEDITESVLSFAKQAVNYDVKFHHQPATSDGEVITIPGMDRIWHFILSAPNPTIGINAINFAIDTYLDHSLIKGSSPSAAEATHVSLVDRCVAQLAAAAAKLKTFMDGTTSGEDEPMVIVPSDKEVRAEELRFARSLLFLRQLLQGLRTRPHYTPPQGSPPCMPLNPDPIKGESIDISYQAFSTGSQSRIRTFTIGDLSTASELADKIAHVTGFSKFTTISGGQRLDLRGGNANQTIRDLKLATAGLLIVRKDSDAYEASYGGRRQSLTLVDSEVLKHFNDLYDLLSLDERFSKEIFDFLVLFPPQQAVRDFVRSPEIGESDMFPIEKPYKLLYILNCLIVCMREEGMSLNRDQGFISHVIKNIDAILMKPGMSELLHENALKLNIACSFVDCLLVALKAFAKSTSDSTQHLFTNPSGLISLILSLLTLDRNDSSIPLNEPTLQRLISSSFATLIEASMKDDHIWAALKDYAQMPELIYSLLLSEPRPGIRKDVAEIIFSLCGESPLQKGYWSNKVSKNAILTGNLATVTGADMVKSFWQAISLLLPRAVEHPQLAQEFFEVALVTFHTVVMLPTTEIPYKQYVQDWGNILLSHNGKEFVGRERVDHVVLGFAYLLKLCLELAISENIDAGTTNLMANLFITLLFPNLSDTQDDNIQPGIPIMNSTTRQEIYSIILLLCQSTNNCAEMLELLEDIIPYDYTYDPAWIFDRSKTIRSAEGYAGLRNLSNTCYLNSLFTQLFMNLDFRKFILEVETSEDDPTQAVLTETKKVFAYLQDTWQKSVDPQNAVDTIRTYDNEPIDINIQMDVDEFYNLLFDRWESQIRSAEDKKKFRSFYGGQLVQQIKSKECEHISERLEPFSAIQCDIKGKPGLEDSLRAYVEGEIMQGDNKYSCTSCGKHVDAVKRACLKDIPDNLIFHLKRFDFDVISMMRSKINDEFHFPERIDMSPFTIDYLSNPDAPIEPDMFELVGVLVHSGTAESGHYYSYIKKRPSAGPNNSWVEFNDSDVTRFDPAKIPDQCFGGTGDNMHSLSHVRFGCKVWNAYMLFYQRVSSMEKAKAVYQDSIGDSPARIPLPLELGNHISLENEVFIRIYCLLDPNHARFVVGLFNRARDINRTENTAIASKIQKISLPDRRTCQKLSPFLIDIKRSIDECPRAAYWLLQWTGKRPLLLRNLLAKSPNSVIRVGFSKLLVTALSRLQDRLGDTDSDRELQSEYHREYMDMLEKVVGIMVVMWSTLHFYSRAWDDYFEVLVEIANLGLYEVETLIEHGFLLRCLEMVWLDGHDSRRLKEVYPAYVRLIEKGRKFSHYKLTELLAIFLENIDIAAEPVRTGQSRRTESGKLALSYAESELVLALGDKRELALLKKVIEKQENVDAARKIFTTFLSTTPAIDGLMDSIVRMLEEGLAVEPASLASPFLEITLLFCGMVPDIDRVRSLIEFATKSVDSINETGGRDHITFIQTLPTLNNAAILEQDELFFLSLVLEMAPYWAPTLLHYDDRLVRNSAFEYLQEILFLKNLDDATETTRQFYQRTGRQLGQACIDKLQTTYLATSNTQTVVDASTVEIIQYVVKLCIEKYFDEENIEGDRAIIDRAGAVLASLEQYTVEMPEDVGSGPDFPSDAWEDNSVIASDSEIGLATSP